MKLKIKIAAVVLMGMSLVIKAQTLSDKFSVSIANNYVKVYQITTKSRQLASNVKISATSHTGNHVGNFTADILVNHHRDVFVKTTSGGYTQGTIKIESDGNGSYFMSYKTTSPNAGKYYFTIEALSSEINITPLPTGQAPTKTVHEHKTNFGTHESGTKNGTGKILNSVYSGNVGIGTTNSGNALLTVNGDSFTTMRLENDTPNKEASLRFRSKSSSGGLLHSDISLYATGTNQGYLGFKVPHHNTVNTGYDMIINHLGNVGIGTINPEAWKLAVNGKIRAKEIKVEAGWSDFVFYDDYELPTLTEVETHIRENGHLKDIPSAKEVAKNGILLGEMDSKLLQKIEELTLYTIQQEKKIKEQANDIKKLKNLNRKFIELQSKLDKLLEQK